MIDQYQKVICCDVDAIVADLNVRWVEILNNQLHETFKKSDMKCWDFADLPRFKGYSKNQLYGVLKSDGLYDKVPVIEGSQEGVAALRKLGYRVVFVSSCVENMTDQKVRWLVRHGFLPKGKHKQHDFISCSDKYLMNMDLMIDDWPEQLMNWVKLRKKPAVVLDQPWNQPSEFEAAHSAFSLWCPRARNWGEIVNHVTNFMSGMIAT